MFYKVNYIILINVYNLIGLKRTTFSYVLLELNIASMKYILVVEHTI